MAWGRAEEIYCEICDRVFAIPDNLNLKSPTVCFIYLAESFSLLVETKQSV
jgi:hypothetical protein